MRYLTRFSSTIFLIIILLIACSASSEKQDDSTQSETAVPVQADSVKSVALPKMLDLGSTSCIPCKKMAPILDSLELVFEGKAEIIFIDVREDKKAAREYGITMIPTQIFFDTSGKEIYRHIGFFSADSITVHLEEIGAVL